MEDIYVIGVGMTPFGKMLDRSIKSLVAEAVTGAFDDAGAKGSDIEAAYFGNVTQGAMEGQHSIRGQIALWPLGISGIPVVNVENACATGTTALYLAVSQLRAGMADVALAVGVEKLFDVDKEKTANLFNGGWDVHEVDKIVGSLAHIGDGVEIPESKRDAVNAPFMKLYASLARGYMREFGMTEEQLAIVASKNHHHSTMNPLSQYQTEMSVEQILAGRIIAWPLTLPMCSPISDGAAAVIICTGEALKRFPNARPLKLLSCVLTTSTERAWTDFDNHICRRAAAKAYNEAGIGPNDIDFAEVHDASSFAEILQTENMGFCELGAGGRFAQTGATSLGGKIPVNVSGGLVSKGHPVGATGLSQIYELAAQLRGVAGKRQVEGARFGLAENGGGFVGVEESTATVTILGL